jgi:hypothetical protein
VPASPLKENSDFWFYGRSNWRYLELGRRDDVKFLVIASDIVYPAGAMSDYEFNFYLPLKGSRHQSLHSRSSATRGSEFAFN